MAYFPKYFFYKNVTKCRSYNPEMQAARFGPYPGSLAATSGISFDLYSYRYLDVSVPCVRLS
jgi:hypothetical protein